MIKFCNFSVSATTGCCFVTFSSKSDALDVQSRLHNQRTIQGVSTVSHYLPPFCWALREHFSNASLPPFFDTCSTLCAYLVIPVTLSRLSLLFAPLPMLSSHSSTPWCLSSSPFSDLSVKHMRKDGWQKKTVPSFLLHLTRCVVRTENRIHFMQATGMPCHVQRTPLSLSCSRVMPFLCRKEEQSVKERRKSWG